MSKRSSLTLVVGVLGGFLVAHWVPGPLGIVTESRAQAMEDDQPSASQTLQGREALALGERFRDEITSSAQLNGKDGSRFLDYTLSLEEGALVELGVSGALHGIVTLYDDQHQFLESAETLRYRAEEAGDYIVVVSGQDARSYGPFTLYPRTIEISESDTLSLDDPMDRWLQDREEVVTLTLEEAGLYQIDMRSTDFDAYLTLEGPDGYQREDDDSGGDLDAQISDFLAPGEYTVRAQTYGGGSGMYTLTAQEKELSAESLRNDGPIAPGESLSGWFSAEPLEYTLEIDEAGIYQIDMTSSAIDAFLELDDDNGYYRENDDGGENLDARLVDFLAPGSYRITARTPYEGGSPGLFTLAVERSELDDEIELQNGGELSVGDTVNGWFSGEDVIYEIEIEESSAVTIAMNSSDFDAYLELVGEGESFTDDDGGNGTDALLEASLLPGRYTVHARGFSAYGSGLFELSLEAEPTEMSPDA